MAMARVAQSQTPSLLFPHKVESPLLEQVFIWGKTDWRSLEACPACCSLWRVSAWQWRSCMHNINECGQKDVASVAYVKPFGLTLKSQKFMVPTMSRKRTTWSTWCSFLIDSCPKRQVIWAWQCLRSLQCQRQLWHPHWCPCLPPHQNQSQN